MCFEHGDYDYDWTARVTIESCGTSPLASRCYECNSRIAPYEWRRYIYQQELETCRICDECGDDYDPDEPQDPTKCKHDYGETFSYDRCETCDKILRAIEDYEAREGCKPSERQPLLGELQDELRQHSDGQRYAALAIESYPELGAVPWLLDVLVGD